ncbi:MAG: DUF748 domain-containing protein [Sedimenticola sp.]
MSGGETAKDNGGRTGNRRGKIWALALLTLAALTLVKLIVLPYGISYGAKRWILANGGDEFSVRNVDFNPFTATLALSDLKIGRAGTTPLQIPYLKLHMAWRPLLDSRIVIKGLSIKGIQIDINQGHPDNPPLIGGVLLPVAGNASATEESLWTLQLERLTLVESTLRYRQQQLSSELIIDKLSLTDVRGLQPESPANLNFQGRIDGANLDITGQLTPLASRPGFSGKIKLDALALDHYSNLLKPAITHLSGQLTLQGMLSIHQETDGAIKVSQKGSITLGNLKLTTPRLTLDNDRLSWDGNFDSQIMPHKGETELLAQGTLKSGSLNFSELEGEARIANERINWQGKLKLSLDQDGTDLTTTGALEVHQLAADFAQTKISVEQLSLTNRTMELQQQRGRRMVSHQGKLTLAAVTLSTPQLTVEGQRLAWGGDLQLDNETTNELNLSAKGTLSSSELKTALLSNDTRVGSGTLDWKGAIEAHSSLNTGESEVKQQGDIDLSDITLNSPEIELSEQRLRWSGRTDISSSEKSQHFFASGALGSERLSANLTEKALALEYTVLNWEGELAGGSGEGAEPFTLSGSLSLDRAQVTKPKDSDTLLSLENLKVSEIKGNLLERITATH